MTVEGPLGPQQEVPSPTSILTSALCTPQAAPLRRLTRREYVATVQALLSPPTPVGSTFTDDPRTRGFDNNATTQSVSEVLAEEYLGGAETLAAKADLSRLAPCRTPSPNDSCARDFISTFGLRAYRRPVTEAEQSRLMAVFQAGKASGGFDGGLRFVLEVMLQAPPFLYRLEGAESGEARPGWVAPYALASRLSYLLWGTMPDEALFAAAAAGELSTAEQVRAQVDRLLADPRARAMVKTFHEQLLQLDSLATLQKAPAFTQWAKLRPAFQRETELFMDDVFWNVRHARAFLDADFTFADATVAAHYGLSLPEGAPFTRVTLPPERRGLLTQGAFLATTAHSELTSPVHRGKFVRQVLLCQDLAPPPPGTATSVPDVGPNATTRERYAAHASDPTCAGCHRLMDPIGLGLESFDAVGAFRTTEHGQAVDVRGELVNAADASGQFEGGAALATKVGGSAEWSRCLVRQWFRFAYGRIEHPRHDACEIDRLEEALASSGSDPVALLTALVVSDSFLLQPTAAETP